MTESPDDFFDGVGGGGAPSFKFNGINTGVRGTIVDQFRTTVTSPSGEVKTYDDGRAIPQLNVTLQTDLRNWDKVTKVPTDEDGNAKPASEDDGLRRIYVKYDMRRAIAVALQSAKAVGGLKNGGELAVKQSGEKPTNKGNPLPLYEARYTAPSATDEFFGGGADSAPAQPAAQPAMASAAATPTPAAAQEEEPPF